MATAVLIIVVVARVLLGREVILVVGRSGNVGEELVARRANVLWRQGGGRGGLDDRGVGWWIGAEDGVKIGEEGGKDAGRDVEGR